MKFLLDQDPIIDMQVLLSSLRIVNVEGESLFPSLLQQFRENCWEILACLGNSLDRADMESLAHTLYIFKGSCHLMGAPRLERMAARLRQDCLDGNMPSNERWNELVQSLDEFVDTVQRFQLVYFCRA